MQQIYKFFGDMTLFLRRVFNDVGIVSFVRSHIL